MMSQPTERSLEQIASFLLTDEGAPLADVILSSLHVWPNEVGPDPVNITEAVMGNTAGLVKIAESIDRFTAEVEAIAKAFHRG